jgi:hypothetical protein
MVLFRAGRLLGRLVVLASTVRLWRHRNQERIWPGDRKVVTIKPPIYDDDLEGARLFPKREVVKRIFKCWVQRTATSIDFMLGFFNKNVENPWWF